VCCNLPTHFNSNGEELTNGSLIREEKVEHCMANDLNLDDNGLKKLTEL